jgi:hypothetical protein
MDEDLARLLADITDPVAIFSFGDADLVPRVVEEASQLPCIGELFDSKFGQFSELRIGDLGEVREAVIGALEEDVIELSSGIRTGKFTAVHTISRNKAHPMIAVSTCLLPAGTTKRILYGYNILRRTTDNYVVLGA